MSSSLINLTLSNELKENEKFGNEDFDVYKFYKLPSYIKIDINIIKKFTGEETFNANKYSKIGWYNIRDKIGNGKMEYIKDPIKKEMMITAWRAITCTDNWGFVSQDIINFNWSLDTRIDDIIKEMEVYGYKHTRETFDYTMKCMQYLVQNGEDEFNKMITEDK